MPPTGPVDQEKRAPVEIFAEGGQMKKRASPPMPVRDLKTRLKFAEERATMYWEENNILRVELNHARQRLARVGEALR